MLGRPVGRVTLIRCTASARARFIGDAAGEESIVKGKFICPR